MRVVLEQIFLSHKATSSNLLPSLRTTVQPHITGQTPIMFSTPVWALWARQVKVEDRVPWRGCNTRQNADSSCHALLSHVLS